MTESDLEKSALHARDQVYFPVFFNKLASYGITAETEQEVYDLLNMAAKSREKQIQKVASAESRYAPVSAAMGGDDQVATQAASIKQAADHFSQDAELYKSALLLGVAQLNAQQE